MPTSGSEEAASAQEREPARAKKPGAASASRTPKSVRGAGNGTAPSPILDRYDMFPHIEERLSMTVREWLGFHYTMHRQYTKYLGKHILKTPFDWIVLGDMIQDTQPEVIIEIGNFEGASALWMAHLLDAMESETQIIGVDILDMPRQVEHPRITWVTGDCIDPETIRKVEELCDGRRGMVIEDSDHKYHVTQTILERYERFVAPGCYFLVEDTIVEFINMPPFPGPLKAVKEFVEARPDTFVIDRTREKYIITHNPMGHLLRIA
jgi:cephalosporin hydroxylase